MSGDKTLRAIADVYERYNISDREDVLVSTWGMNEADAREQIRTNSTPERAAELIKASDELKAIIEQLIKDITSDIMDATKAASIPNHLLTRRTETFDRLLTVCSDDFRRNKQDIVTTGRKGELSITKNGNEFLMANIENGVIGSRILGTCAKKLFYYILHLITVTDAMTPNVKLNIAEYSNLIGYDISTECKLKTFRKQIMNDLDALMNIKIQTPRGKTWIVGGYERMENGSYSIAIPQTTLDALSRRNRPAVAPIPTCLYLIDNKGQSSFSIGIKLNTHFYNKKNAKEGNNTVISIDKLLLFAPAIKSVQEYEAQNRHHFKEDIKKPLERALNDNIAVGFLQSWNYKRPGKNGEKVNQEEVEKMSFSEYKQLNIEFCPKIIDTTAKKTN